MIPLGARLAVARQVGERTLASGLVIPAPDTRSSLSGVVMARGQAPELEARVGDRILYSARCDVFELEDGTTVDIVEENSVIALL